MPGATLADTNWIGAPEHVSGATHANTNCIGAYCVISNVL
jgi:hypothetical protein